MALQKYIFEVDLVLVEKDQSDRTGRRGFSFTLKIGTTQAAETQAG